MARQRGRFGPVTGLVSIRGTPKFTAMTRRFNLTLDSVPKSRAGRGVGAWRKVRATAPGGQLVLSALVSMVGYPHPSTWRGEPGQITLTYHRDAKEVVNVEVTAVSYSASKTDSTKWAVTFTCVVTSMPTATGFGGTQPDPAEPVKSDVELYEGLTKTYDPKGLIDSATQTFDVWPLGDTDSEERTRIAAVIAATTQPLPGMKVKTASLLAGRDYNSGTVTIQWARTDSEEDYVNPETVTISDPLHLASVARSAGIFSTPASPGGNFVARTTSTRELHDGATLTVVEYGLRDTKGDIEYPQSPLDNDPYDLVDHADLCLVTDSATPPTTPTAPQGQHVGTITTRINDIRWQHVFRFANLNSEQQIVFPESILNYDPSMLLDEDRQAFITSDSSTPATPTPRGTATKLRRVLKRRVGGTPEKWLHIFEFGHRTTEEDIEMPGTVQNGDAYSLDGWATITIVDAEPDPVVLGIPAAPFGVFVSYNTEQIHGETPPRWKHTFRYENLTSADRVNYPASPDEEDPSSLRDAEQVSVINNSATPPATPTPTLAGVKIRRRVTRRVSNTPEQWQHVFYFARTNEEDDVEMPETVTRTDVSEIDGKATITQVTASGTAPATPSAPLGQHVATQTVQLHDTRWKHTFHYAHNTSEQDILFPDSPVSRDPSSLQDIERYAVTSASSTLPAEPTPIASGVKIRERISRRLTGTPEKWEHTFVFGRRNTEDDVEMPETFTRTDVSEIDGTAQITQVTSSGTAPATPAAPLGQHVGTRTEQLHDTRWKHTFAYAHNTSEQNIIFPDSPVSRDPASLKDLERVAVTSASSALPADPTPITSGVKIRERISRRLTGTPEKWEHTFVFGRTDTEDDIELPNTVTTTDISEIEGKATITVVTSSGTAPAVPAAPLGQHLGTETEQLHNTRWRHTFAYGHTTSEQSIIFPDSPIEVDPSGLTDEEKISQTTASSTPPADPTPSNASLKIRRRRSVRVAGTPELWEHTYTFAWRNTEDDIEMDGSVTTDDQSDLVDKRTVTVVTSSVTPSNPGTPTGLQWVSVDTKQIHGGKWEHRHHYARNTNAEEITFSESHIITDADDLTDREVITEIKNTATPGSPTVAATLTKLVDIRSQRLNRTGTGTGDGYWKHTWIYARNTNSEEIERRESVTILDPLLIKSTADVVEVYPTASVPVAPAAPSGELQLVSSVTQTLNDLMSKRKSRFDVNNSKQEIEYAGSSVEFNQFDNITEVTETVEANSNTLASIAATMATTLKSNRLVDKFSVRRLTPTQIVKRIEYIDGFQVMDAESSGGVKPVNAVLLSGGVHVYVSQVVKRGDDWWVKIEPQWVWGADITFRIRQRRSMNGTLTFNIDKIGTRNLDEFLGIPIGYLTFLGTAPHTNRNIVSPHVIEESHYFRFTSRGLFTEAGITMGWLHTSVDCSGITAGSWVPASTFGWAAAPLNYAEYVPIIDLTVT